MVALYPQQLITPPPTFCYYWIYWWSILYYMWVCCSKYCTCYACVFLWRFHLYYAFHSRPDHNLIYNDIRCLFKVLLVVSCSFSCSWSFPYSCVIVIVNMNVHVIVQNNLLRWSNDWYWYSGYFLLQIFFNFTEFCRWQL